MYSENWSSDVFSQFYKSHPRVAFVVKNLAERARENGYICGEEDIKRALVHCIQLPKHGGPIWKQFKAYCKIAGTSEGLYEQALVARIIHMGRFCREESEQLALLDVSTHSNAQDT